jgi:tetrahydromethanopterin S-methyltransferase subunit B
LQNEEEICNNLVRIIKKKGDYMKKIRITFLAFLCMLILASCSGQTDKPKPNSMPQMLDVKLSITPEKGVVNQPITFNAKVSQGKEKVNDADEVTFEIWRSLDPNHEKMNVKQGKDGVCSLSKTFKQDGTYYVISHVTARGMHNMPKKEFVIGQPSEEETSKTNSTMKGMNMK